MRYRMLTTLTDRSVVTRSSSVLEDAGIPVMIEHVEMLDGNAQAYGFRMLVPEDHFHRAWHLIRPVSSGMARKEFLQALH